jgi:hypothetical protein
MPGAAPGPSAVVPSRIPQVVLRVILIALPPQDLPGCEYLASSPNGRPYELMPTVANIVRAIMVITGLGFGGGSAPTDRPLSLADLSLAMKLSQRRAMQVAPLRPATRAGSFVPVAGV